MPTVRTARLDMRARRIVARIRAWDPAYVAGRNTAARRMVVGGASGMRSLGVERSPRKASVSFMLRFLVTLRAWCLAWWRSIRQRTRNRVNRFVTAIDPSLTDRAGCVQCVRMRVLRLLVVLPLHTSDALSVFHRFCFCHRFRTLRCIALSRRGCRHWN